MNSTVLESGEWQIYECGISHLEANYQQKGEIVMGATGKKDKGNKEQKKKPKHNLKEKRKLKNEKKSK